MSRHVDLEGEEVGRAMLVDGEVRFTGDMAPGGSMRAQVGFDEAAVYDTRGQQLTPADGRRYLEALPRWFVGSHFWAAPAD